MEIRIKTGSLTCEYTGEEAKVLVKLCDDEKKPGGSECVQATAWMGRKALEDALKLIDSIEGVPQKVVLTESPQHRLPTQVQFDGSSPLMAQSTTSQAGNTPDSPAVINQFEKSLIELIQNPPKSREGEKDGVSEAHVKDLVSRFRATFQSPVASMFPLLEKHLGMPKERFEMMMSVR